MKRSAAYRDISPPVVASGAAADDAEVVPPRKLAKIDSDVARTRASPLDARAAAGGRATIADDTPPEASAAEGAQADAAARSGRSIKVITWNCDGLKPYISYRVSQGTGAGMDAFVTRNVKSKGKRRRSSASDSPSTSLSPPDVTKDSSAGPKRAGIDRGGGQKSASFLTTFVEIHKPDVLFIQEIHIRNSERADVLSALRRDVPGYTAELCLPVNSQGPARAGVLSLWRSELPVLRTRSVAWDGEGRVHMLALDTVWLVNCYAPNASAYPYKHPRTGTITGTRAERKSVFQKLLRRELALMETSSDAQLDQDGHVDDAQTSHSHSHSSSSSSSSRSAGKAWLLCGDLNVSRYAVDCYPRLRVESPHGELRREFNELFGGAEIVDVVRERYPTARKFSWHARSKPQGEDSARVDLILLHAGTHKDGDQDGTVVRCTDADTMEYVDRGKSDHSPLYAVVAY